MDWHGEMGHWRETAPGLLNDRVGPVWMRMRIAP